MAWSLSFELFLLINLFLHALFCQPPANVTITTTPRVTMAVSSRTYDIATVEIDTTLPWARAHEDPNNALVPISTQLQAAQSEHIEGAPTLVDVRQNRNLTKVITQIRVDGTREEVQQALQGAFSISDYVQAFNITGIQNN